MYWRPCLSGLPFNSHQQRANLPIKLELGAAASVEKWLVPRIDDAVVRRIQTACGFYARALQAAEHDAEAAYLHLVIAGEVLASLDQLSAEEQFDEETLRDLAEVETKVGQDCAKRLARRMTSKRKGFADLLIRQLDEAFFERSEPHANDGCRFRLEGMTSSTNRQFDMRRCLQAVYDLRSRHVHSGTPFGYWVAPKRWVNDLVIGRPSLPDKGSCQGAGDLPNVLRTGAVDPVRPAKADGRNARIGRECCSRTSRQRSRKPTYPQPRVQQQALSCRLRFRGLQRTLALNAS